MLFLLMSGEATEVYKLLVQLAGVQLCWCLAGRPAQPQHSHARPNGILILGPTARQGRSDVIVLQNQAGPTVLAGWRP